MLQHIYTFIISIALSAGHVEIYKGIATILVGLMLVITETV